MNKSPCLCDGRQDIRCDREHCDLAGPGAAGDPNQCRVCWLRLGRPGTLGARKPRSEPCLYLGEVVDKLGCDCPARWQRKCEVHNVCTLNQCKTCSDYES